MVSSSVRKPKDRRERSRRSAAQVSQELTTGIYRPMLLRVFQAGVQESS
jgi:hypothetical protein